jgi:hypothetical protein
MYDLEKVKELARGRVIYSIETMLIDAIAHRHNRANLSFLKYPDYFTKEELIQELEKAGYVVVEEDRKLFVILD